MVEDDDGVELDLMFLEAEQLLRVVELQLVR